MTAPHTPSVEYDLIFAGGGTTACITAGRLAEAFPALSILVLEGGPTTQDKPEHTRPMHFFTHLAPTSKVMQFTKSAVSDDVGGRAIVVPSGRCVGGGSSVNWMMYNRAAASDYDDWETEHANPGWGSKDLIPLLQKSETYEPGPTNATHGGSGPLKVTHSTESFDLVNSFLELGPKYEKDRPVSNEGNALNLASINVFYKLPKYISSDGKRSDAAHHYVYNKALKNLTVLDGCLVKRVVTKDGVATAVEFLFNKDVYADAPQDVHTVAARKLIVVGAGAMGSPLILERSGIGRKDILERAGIEVVQDLPGVGDNYTDHTFMAKPYIAVEGTKTVDPIFRVEPEAWGAMIQQYEKDKSGLMATNAVDVAIKFRPRQDELAELGPEFLDHWNKFFANKPDKPIFLIAAFPGMLGDASGLDAKTFLSAGVILSYPASRGHLHISAADPYAAPDFLSGFMSNVADVITLRYAYKKTRELFRRMPEFRGAVNRAHPAFPEGSPATLKDVTPVALDAPKIVYSAEDNKAIDENLRKTVETTWHSLGTCAMKPREKGGVVDSKLNVYGIKNLKVADLSIPPSNVNSNTYSTATAIGEKAALIIAEELGGSL